MRTSTLTWHVFTKFLTPRIILELCQHTSFEVPSILPSAPWCFAAKTPVRFNCRQEFTAYAKKSVDRLTRSIVQTASALEGNKWLAGAKNIYNTVQQKRSSQGQSTKPFMDWVGIQQEVERLAVGEL